MSSHGYPDWTTPVTQINIEGFAGLEELAARLSSIVPWDLHGNIILKEDFESELVDWEDVSDGLDCEAVRSSRHKYSGDWSAKLYNPGGDGFSATLERWLQYPGLNRYALFAMVHLEQGSREFRFGMSFWTGSHRYNVTVYYNQEDTLLEIISDIAAEQTIDAELALVEDYEAWFPLLVTFDLAAGYYDKLYFAHKEYNISTAPLKSFELEASPVAKISISADSYADGAYTTYFDNIVLAKNVP